MSEQIKSAWEIAMEKAEKLGKLSEEEMKKTRRDTYGLIGGGIAKKYLSGLPIRDLHIELGKYTGDERELVMEFLFSTLAAAISLDDVEGTIKALDAWLSIKQSDETGTAVNDINNLLQDYKNEIETKDESAAGEAEKDILHQLEGEGISGPAILPNLTKSSRIIQIKENIKKEYSAKLAAMKNKLPA